MPWKLAVNGPRDCVTATLVSSSAFIPPASVTLSRKRSVSSAVSSGAVKVVSAEEADARVTLVPAVWLQA